MNISHQNNDVILKYISEAFKDTALSFYGLDTPKITAVLPTQLPMLEVSKADTDFIFLLEDGSYMHLEFQTTVKRDDLARFLLYDARLYKKDSKTIRTAVIYSGNIKKAPNLLDIGSINYNVENVYMYHYNGDIIYEELKTKVAQHKRLDKLDILNLVFLPLMKSKINRNEVAINAVNLAQKIQDDEQKVFCIWTVVGISNKFLDKKYIKKLKEALKMFRVVDEIRKEAIEEGVQKGKKEGVSEVAKELLKKGIDASLVAEVVASLGVMPKKEFEKLKKA